jgi:hypothetical protein
MGKITTKQRVEDVSRGQWILTPVGYRERNRVVRMKKGQHSRVNLKTMQWEIVATASGTSFPLPLHKPLPDPYNGNQDWVSYAETSSANTTPFTLCKSTWKVPGIPAKTDQQAIYLFNALQHVGISGTDYILQPVLVYGEYPAENGDECDTKGKWMIASFWVPSSDNPGPLLVSPGIKAVLPGDTVTGVIELKSNDDGSYLYDCYFDGCEETRLSVSTPYLQLFDQTLEIWGVTDRSMLPPDNATTFYDIQTYIGGVVADVKWTFQGDINCQANGPAPNQVDVMYPT